MSKGVKFGVPKSDNNKNGANNAKNRAQTSWDLTLNNHMNNASVSYSATNVSNPYPNSSNPHQSSKNGARIRSQTGHSDNIINPLISPRRSNRPINMKRPLTERGVKSIQKMWVHSTSYSVFSMHGMDAMLSKLQNTKNGNKSISPTSSRKNTGHGHYKQSSLDNNTPISPSNGIQSPLASLSSNKPKMNKFQTPSMSLVMQPGLFSKDDASGANWETKIKKWETEGEWIECRESVNGRVLWYNSISNRIVFDVPPDGVQQLPPTKYTKELGPKHDEFFLNRPIEPYEDEDIVAGLLQFDGHQWDFNNDIVDVYRAQSYMRDHRSMLPKPQQYCFPEYFSMSPLPELPGGKFLAKIRLPEEFSAHRRYSSVQIKVDYTAASDAIKQGVEKLDPPHNKERKDFILKVVGQEAYMYGRRKIIDYEAVRDAVRNEDDVEFVLIKRTDFKQRVDYEKLKQKEYVEQFKHLYPLKIINNINSLLEYEDIVKKTGGINPKKDDKKKHKNVNVNGFKPTDVLSLYECDWHYRLKIEGLTNVTQLPRFDYNQHKSVYVIAELWMGDMVFEHATLMTSNSLARNDIRWGHWLSSRNQTFSQIPREAILCFMVMAIPSGSSSSSSSSNKKSSKNKNKKTSKNYYSDISKHECLAWCRLSLIDHRHKLRCGKYLLNMWEIPQFKVTKDGPKTDPYRHRPFRYRGSTSDKSIVGIEVDTQCQLLIEFDKFAFDVIAPLHLPHRDYSDNSVGGKLNHQQLSKQQKQLIAQILIKTPLEVLDIKERTLIWQSRDLLWHDPSALPAFLRSVNWTNLLYISEAHKYLDLWASPKRAEDALEYLSYKFSDTFVREKAISWLNDLHDGDLNKILLQLVQCLKYESHHNSSLSQFLLMRSLKNPYQIGHFFFWHLKSEYLNLKYAERFGVLMEEYLLHAGEHSRQLFTQSVLLKRLEVIAEKIQNAKTIPNNSNNNVKRLFHRELNKLNKDLPNNSYIQMPVNPRWHAKKIKVSECRYMSSKKVPLWLVFENADPYASDIAIMFKAGDDLRQDMLTLQMITVMDRLWLDSKLDLHLKPYSVLATGYEVGMLQIVLNSVTVNTINMEYGGAFNERTIDSYLKKYNTYDQSLKKARENFARSCAGYCVATCCLGIGDRHSDNYMVHQNGQFFHIDFGHFLGNFKSKFGIKRERSPFVFTPQMKFAIDNGAKKCHLYDEFLNWCAEAYNVLRQRSRLLLVLFSLMVSAGIPELSQQSDIAYFKNMLNIKYDVKKATQHVHKQISSALKDKARLMDNHIHLTVHKT